MKRILTIILGNLLITGAYAFITVPGKIINGGVTSFSMVLGQVCRIDLSLFVNLLTLFLLLLCLIYGQCVKLRLLSYHVYLFSQP